MTRGEVRSLGYAAARAFLSRRTPSNGHAPIAVLGRDTRGSGTWLCRALIEGFADAGCATLDAGVIPTPAVSYLTPRRGAILGAVVSASHNPPEFNGIKFFDAAGLKASPEVEEEVERGFLSRARSSSRRRSAAPASRLADPSSAEDYLDFLRSTFPATRDLRGLRLVVDGAHGAASRLAPGFFRSLGAEVFALGCSPDGSNINRGCGALETGAMREAVVRRRAHAGISLDGDADRAILADEHGRLFDGDALIAMSALAMHEKGMLWKDKVVLTVMSNLGLIRHLEGKGIGAVLVPVGDRNVTEALNEGGYALGGENSGHIVFRRLAPTGDGMLTSLQALAVLVEEGGPMSRFRHPYRSYPQILRNIHVEERVPLEKLHGFCRVLARAESALKGRGRVFVRYSGTEPLLRILVEGPEHDEVSRLCGALEEEYRKETRSCP
ncbi:MAG: phosphoglucosamine mutase [Elusimicrobiota bacterium]